MDIAIVSRSGPVLEAYKRFFGVYGVNLIHALSISELYKKFPGAIVAGFVVEIHSVVKSSETEKVLLHTMMEIFPSVKTNWNSEEGFRALYNDSDKSGEENLRAFLRDCRNFKPRPLRKKRRHEKKFNVLYWPVEASQETVQRAFTAGCLLRGPVRRHLRSAAGRAALVSVVLKEVAARPFKVMVKWRLPWGIAMRIPGFGGRFRRYGRRPRRKIGDGTGGQEWRYPVDDRTLRRGSVGRKGAAMQGKEGHGRYTEGASHRNGPRGRLSL